MGARQPEFVGLRGDGEVKGKARSSTLSFPAASFEPRHNSLPPLPFSLPICGKACTVAFPPPYRAQSTSKEFRFACPRPNPTLLTTSAHLAVHHSCFCKHAELYSQAYDPTVGSKAAGDAYKHEQGCICE
jgi:hypothetical protein